MLPVGEAEGQQEVTVRKKPAAAIVKPVATEPQSIDKRVFKMWHAASGEAEELPDPELAKDNIGKERETVRWQLKYDKKTVFTLTEHNFGSSERARCIYEFMKELFLKGFTSAQLHKLKHYNY